MRENAHTFPLYDLSHVLCDILVPITGVIVVLPLVSSITTVPVCPYGAVLDSRPAFLQTLPFRVFILLSTDLSVKSTKRAGVHESSAGSRAAPRGLCGDGGD